MKKWWFVIFVPIYLLITFFGLGPVLLADGSTSERIITFLIVVVLYLGVTFIFRRLTR
ncbi:MAG TPA: hypothetical protein VM660_06195 [Bacillus sp. (in: firmicutes)]|nr:hypothetical protein [Bacillus sp. (in: firmicutes)]HVI21621.1 hypothetical protein [Bacillus sp. (in: firmicutes)]